MLSLRLLSRLVSQVKLEGACREDDITKKHDLVYIIISMITELEDDEILAQTYSIIGYLFKNNFDALNFDLDSSEKFIDITKNVLAKEKLDRGVYLNIIKVLGILGAQSLITLKNSQ